MLSYLWLGFRSTYGPVISFLGLILALMAFWTLGETLLSAAWLIAALAVALLIALALFGALWHATTREGELYPRVLHVQTAPAPYPNDKVLLTISPSSFFLRNAEATVFVAINGTEIPAALGRVVEIQTDMKVQVLAAVITSNADVATRFPPEDDEGLRSIIIKPGIPDSLRAFANA